MYFISGKPRKKKSIGSKNWFIYGMGLSNLDKFVLKLLAFVMPYFLFCVTPILEYHFKYAIPKSILWLFLCDICWPKTFSFFTPNSIFEGRKRTVMKITGVYRYLWSIYHWLSEKWWSYEELFRMRLEVYHNFRITFIRYISAKWYST